MSTDPGPPPLPPYPGEPPMVEAEGSPPPTKTRPAWIGWAAGVGVVVIAVAAFFVTKAIAGSGGSTAAATAGNGATSNSPGANSGSATNGGFQGRFPGTSGEITAINGTTLTVKDRQNQSVNVTTSDSTRITVEKTVAVSDIAKGDRVAVNGTRSQTTIAASRISIMNAQGQAPGNGSGAAGTPPSFNGQGDFAPPGGFNGQGPPVTDANGNPTGTGSGSTNRRRSGGFAIGTVTAVDGGTITISGFDGSTVKVTTTSSTTVTKSVPGSLGDLKVGDDIRAVGDTASNGTLAATSINEGSGGFGFFGGGRRGQGTP